MEVKKFKCPGCLTMEPAESFMLGLRTTCEACRARSKERIKKERIARDGMGIADRRRLGNAAKKRREERERKRGPYYKESEGVYTGEDMIQKMEAKTKKDRADSERGFQVITPEEGGAYGVIGASSHSRFL